MTRRDPSERRAQRPSGGGSRVAIFAAVGVAILGAAVWFTTRPAEAAGKGSRDLNKILVAFDKAWNAGNVDAMAALFHPDKRSEHRRQLEAARDGRGWTDGFPTVTGSSLPNSSQRMSADLIAEGETLPADGDTAKCNSVHEANAGNVVCFWQYMRSQETWLMYAIELPPPALEPRVKGFEEAWNTGNVADMRAFLTPGREDKLMQAFAKVADKLMWDKDFITIEPDRIEPATARLETLGITGRYPTSAKSHYDSEQGPMSFRWALNREADAWCVKAIDPPNPKR